MTEGTSSDLRLPSGSAGGPVFSADGVVVGLTSIPSRVVRTNAVCEVVAATAKTMKDAVPPDATHLPIEPLKPFPVDALKDAVKRRAGQNAEERHASMHG